MKQVQVSNNYIINIFLILSLSQFIVSSAKANYINNNSGKYLVLNLGKSIRKIGEIEDISFFTISCEKQNNISKIRGKSGVEFGNITLLSTNTRYLNYNQFILGIYHNILFGQDNLYLSLGIGGYLKTKRTERIGTYFTFSEKISIGTKINDIVVELYLRHFSNASMSKENSGQNFLGLSFSVSL